MSGVSQATGPRRGSILSVAVAVAVAVAAIVPASTLEAQESRFSLWVGAGGALPLSQPGLDRKVGPGALAAIELAAMPRLSLRAELSGDLQDLNTRSHGLVSGDLQQARGSLAARFTPTTIGRVAPYVLAGAGWFWQSDRIILGNTDNPVPSATYRETSSRNRAGAILGAGGTADAGRLRLFGEARWTRAGSSDATTDLSILAGVTIPLGR